MATSDHDSRFSSWPGLSVGGACRRWSSETLQAAVVAADAGLTFGSALAVGALYRGGPSYGPGDLFVSMALIATVLFVGFMAFRGAYRVVRLSDARGQVVRVLQAWVFVYFSLAWIAFLLRLTDDIGRGAVTLWFPIGGFVLVTAHGLGAMTLSRAHARGTVVHRRVAVVAIAEASGARRIVDRLLHRGVEVAAVSLVPPKETEETLPVPDVAAEVGRALADGRLDDVFVFASWNERRRIEELRAELASVPVPVHLFADHEMDRMLRRPRIEIGDLIGLELERAPLDRVDRAAKRLLDIAVAGVGLILLSPLMALTALAIVAESGLPILFRQRRKGFGARPFAILKFRSMTVRQDGAEVPQACRQDARVTRIGRMIRRTSIDELPQLLNVLRGEMSIVGPRPHALAHDDYYDGRIASYALRQHVKPGLTGWAQIHGLRGETRDVDQMRARVEHDLWYIDNWSIWLDIRIILVTAVKIFFDPNAY